MAARPLLLIEDETTIRALIAEALADEGYAVETAGSPQEARRLLAAHRPDGYALVLSDSFVQSPADPFTWLEEVRRHTTAPVVIASAHAESVFAGWQERGVAGQLSKPFDLDALSDLVRRFYRLSLQPRETQ